MDFKKYYVLPASPEEIYLALTTPHTIRLWTGEEAVMSTQVGSEFSLWGGNICGKNLAFEPNKMIQQEWYFGDNSLPSIVTIKLHEAKQGTSVEIRHTNIPQEDYDAICEGWDIEYMGALEEFYSPE
jgi:activator of HSP90 ATPase